MNHFLKAAYDAGAQQAMVDMGLVKEAAGWKTRALDAVGGAGSGLIGAALGNATAGNLGRDGTEGLLAGAGMGALAGLGGKALMRRMSAKGLSPGVGALGLHEAAMVLPGAFAGYYGARDKSPMSRLQDLVG
jgi:hypothetical protein